MKHFGDIIKINGAEVPMVDIITGGSPCQDLSVAGKRAGLKHSDKGDEETTRSGLFMEQIRIVKEMRDECIRQLRVRGADVDIRLLKPRFLVWENVTGAFSSNKGEDFRCVLEEICRVADQTATVPMPEKGKWSTSGCIVGDGWSVAWRVHDAQFWGVPQRRKRIALVADFGGESAPEILFERKGLSGDIAKSGKERQGITATAERSIGKAISFQERAGKPGVGKGILIQNERTGALSTLNNQSVMLFEPRSQDGVHRLHEDGVCPSLNTMQGGQRQPCVAYANEAYDKWSESEKSASLRASGGVYGGGSESLFVGYLVRRLTPLECERLQGFPDGWTDIGDWIDSKGKKHKGDADSPRYKALGNSIALPFWEWMAARMVQHIDNDPTMASLFDGIGGFPLVFSRCGVDPVWNSEIESFPEAVTTKHFGDEERGIVGDYKRYL